MIKKTIFQKQLRRILREMERNRFPKYKKYGEIFNVSDNEIYALFLITDLARDTIELRRANKKMKKQLAKIRAASKEEEK
jgi:hypothetical protein